MSKVSDLIISVQEEIELGKLSFREIAAKFEISYEDVNAIATEYADWSDVGCEFDEKVG
jgi:hypothetical protein